MFSKRKEPKFAIDFSHRQKPVLNTDNKKWSIVIQDLLISCRIGIYPKEQDVYQDVLINLECDYYAPLPTAVNTDVSQVLCYDSLSQEIQAIAQRGHIHFLESFAETIADYCLKDPRTRTVKLSIMKLNALDNAKSAGVKITRRSYVPKVRGLSV